MNNTQGNPASDPFPMKPIIYRCGADEIKIVPKPLDLQPINGVPQVHPNIMMNANNGPVPK